MLMIRPVVYRAAACGVALVLVSCGGSNPPESAPTPAGASASTASSTRYDPDVITRAELDQASLGDVDAMAIVKQLRPRFLAFRGNVSGSDQTGAGTVQVRIDNGRLGSPDLLSTIRASEIQEMRYLSAAAAAQRYGSVSKAGPVIEVRRR
jgi:hypothetical protein